DKIRPRARAMGTEYCVRRSSSSDSDKTGATSATEYVSSHVNNSLADLTSTALGRRSRARSCSVVAGRRRSGDRIGAPCEISETDQYCGDGNASARHQAENLALSRQMLRASLWGCKTC